MLTDRILIYNPDKCWTCQLLIAYVYSIAHEYLFVLLDNTRMRRKKKSMPKQIKEYDGYHRLHTITNNCECIARTRIIIIISIRSFRKCDRLARNIKMLIY